MCNIDASGSGASVSSILGEFSPQALHRPDKVALVWEGGSRTYRELRDRALRLAASLRARGLRAGDRVATLLYNRGETFELYFACAYAGLTLVPMSFRLAAAELASIMSDCEPAIIFTEPELEATLRAALEQQPSPGGPVVLLEPDGAGAAYEEMASGGPSFESPHFTDVQMILYTSGSTGRPKGVAMRHSAIMWCAFMQLSQFRGLNSDAVMLLNAPMFNTAAMNESSIPTFLAGGTVAILPSRKWSAERLGDAVARWGVTHLLMFPSMFRPVLEHDARSPLPFGSVKWWYTGGENCPPALMAEVRRRWPNIHLAISYGSTESGMVTLVEGEDIEAHAGSVGRIAPGQSLRLLSPEGRDVPPGEVGEVWTAGPAVMRNYWNAPELDAETVRDGWLKIGDLARMDEEGWIYIVGRCKDLIISKGQNIYPAEIENVIRRHPAVSDIACVPLPDPEFGEVVCAAIVLRAGQTATAEGIVGFALEHLASYKKPRHVVFLDDLPLKNATKVDKAELAKICQRALAGASYSGVSA